MPTVQSSMPKKALISPLTTDFPEMEMMTERPNVASMNISAGPKFMATSAIRGDRNVMIRQPMTPPQKEENMATERAFPAWPFFVMG